MHPNLLKVRDNRIKLGSSPASISSNSDDQALHYPQVRLVQEDTGFGGKGGETIGGNQNVLNAN